MVATECDVVAMAKRKCRALQAVYSYLWRTLCLLLGGTIRRQSDDGAHLCT